MWEVGLHIHPLMNLIVDSPDLDRLEGWSLATRMEFSKCKVLHMAQGNPK